MTDTETMLGWQGRKVVDPTGDKIGKVEAVYLDDDTGRPEWALIDTGLFGQDRFVPLAEAREAGDNVEVPYEKSRVKDAPSVDTSQEHLSQDEERQLYEYYGLDYTEAPSDSGLGEDTVGGREETTDVAPGVTTGGTAEVPTAEATGTTERTDEEGAEGAVGRDVSGPTTDRAMTRSEEELQVGTQQREVGKARLRKYVVTENVQTTVPVEREEVRVEREPITDANVDEATGGPDLSEEEHEVTLREEVPVVDKKVVPKERVRLDTETVTEEHQVSEEVRKEEIDTAEGETRRTT